MVSIKDKKIIRVGYARKVPWNNIKKYFSRSMNESIICLANSFDKFFEITWSSAYFLKSVGKSRKQRTSLCR